MLIIRPVITGYEIQSVKDIGDVPEWKVVAVTPAHIALVTDHVFTDEHSGNTSRQCPLCIKNKWEQEHDARD